MIDIYHNPRCSKSRQCLQLLEATNKELHIIKYLDDPLSKEQLRTLLRLLNIKPIELVRKNEAVWKSNYKNKNLTDDEIIQAMLDEPKLMERPIVVHGDKAVIGRPPEAALTIV